jgi:hypothetical protein
LAACGGDGDGGGQTTTLTTPQTTAEGFWKSMPSTYDALIHNIFPVLTSTQKTK